MNKISKSKIISFSLLTSFIIVIFLSSLYEPKKLETESADNTSYTKNLEKPLEEENIDDSRDSNTENLNSSNEDNSNNSADNSSNSANNSNNYTVTNTNLENSSKNKKIASLPVKSNNKVVPNQNKTTSQSNTINNIAPDNIVYSTQIGYINNYSEKDGNIYISFDEVEFFTGSDAKREVLKDNALYKMDENGGIYDGYYLRNNEKISHVYKFDQNINIKLCQWVVDDNSNNNSAMLVNVSPNYFKDYFNHYIKDGDESRGLLFWIDTYRDTVVNIRMQYTP